MTRTAFFAILLTLLPPSCAKILGQKAGPDPSTTAPPDPTPTPLPVTSATTPPVFTVDTSPPPTITSTTPPPSPDLARARVFHAAGEHKKVKALLEKKARAGKVSPEEAQICLQSCLATKDKACVDGIRAKYPNLSGDE
jgi:hypothetical protein